MDRPTVRRISFVTVRETTPSASADELIIYNTSSINLEGDSASAIRILQIYSKEELGNFKIGEVWALHCLPPLVFLLEDLAEQTKALISKYLEAGWDINSETCRVARAPLIRYLKKEEPLSSSSSWIPAEEGALRLSGFTLLHLVCLYKAGPMVKFLVEQGGANVNSPTGGGGGGGGGGNVRLFPLHISIIRGDWGSAEYLLDHGANPKEKGTFDVSGFNFTEARRAIEKIDELQSRCFTALELVLRIGDKAGRALLEKMLQIDGVQSSLSASDFHVAIEGGDPHMASRIFQSISETAKPSDLCGVQLRSCCYEDGTGIDDYPSLLPLVNSMNRNLELVISELPTVASLLAGLVSKGYNCNLEEQLFVILNFSWEHDRRDNILLKQLLQCEHVNLDVRNWKGQGPVEYALRVWEERCVFVNEDEEEEGVRTVRSGCSSWGYEAVKLLVEHGAVVSDLTLTPESFKYHTDSKELMKILYTAGAKIDDRLFEFERVRVCSNRGNLECRGTQRRIRAELQQLREWKAEKDTERTSGAAGSTP